jgi:hypothetical protein
MNSALKRALHTSPKGSAAPRKRFAPIQQKRAQISSIDPGCISSSKNATPPPPETNR